MSEIKKFNNYLYSGLFFLLTLTQCVQAQETNSTQDQFINPGAIEITHPEQFDRIIAISDVHGMKDHLVTLLQASKLIDENLNWIAKNTLLVVVGDSIDKGTASLEVLDLWIALAKAASNNESVLIHLLGNHEAEFLANPYNDKAVLFLAELKEKGIALEEVTSAQYPRGRFLKSAPLALKIGGLIFSHAGFYPDMEWESFKLKASAVLNQGNYNDPFLSADDSILEMKKWDLMPKKRALMLARLDKYKLKGLVYGHQPNAMNIEGKVGRSIDGRFMKIDSGMSPEAGSHPGTMLLFPHPIDLVNEPLPQVKAILPSGEITEIAVEGKN